MTASIPTPHADDPRWLIAIGERQMGPYDTAQIAQWVVSKRLDEDCLAWRDGMAGWAPIRTIPDLRQAFEQAPADAAGGGAFCPAQEGLRADFRSYFRLLASPLEAAPGVYDCRLSAIGALFLLILLLPLAMLPAQSETSGRFYILSLAAGGVTVLGLAFLCLVGLRLGGSPARHWSDPFRLLAGMAAPVLPALFLAWFFGWGWLLLPGVLAGGMVAYALMIRAFRCRTSRGFFGTLLICTLGIWGGDGVFRHGVGAIAELLESIQEAPARESTPDNGATKVEGAEITGAASAAPAGGGVSSGPAVSNELEAGAARLREE